MQNIQTKPFFFLQQINAYELNSNIIMDLVTYENPSIIESYRLEKIFNSEHSFDDSGITRFEIDLDKQKIKQTVLTKKTTKVPTINTNCCMKKHQFVWATGSDNVQDYTNQLKKIDVCTSKEIIWQQKGCYTRDPIFVQKPNAKTEDDGIILSVVLDAQKKQTFLIVLDGQSCKEIGRATIAHPIPFTLHGKFFKNT